MKLKDYEEKNSKHKILDRSCFQEERKEYIREKDSWVKMMGNVLQDSCEWWVHNCYTL